MVVVDTETTGLSWSTDRIIELAVVTINDGEITSAESMRCNPGVPIPPGMPHGLTDADVADSPLIDWYASAIKEWFRGRVPAAYGVDFDRSFFLEASRTWGNMAIKHDTRWIDILTWARILYPDLPSRRLADMTTNLLGENAAPAHRAKNDALNAARLLLHFAEVMPDDLGEVLRVQDRAYTQHLARFGRSF